LLENFGVLGICLDDAFVSVSRSAVLTKHKGNKSKEKKTAYVFLLFENIPYLEPYVGMCQRTWRITEDTVKAGK